MALRQDTFVACAEERALATSHRLALMAEGRADSHPAREVYEQLLEDYPAESIAWVLAGHWRGPVDVELDQIDFSTRASWTATKDGRVEHFAKRIGSDGNIKPVILVQRPGNPLLEIIDGHHRVLACEKLGRPVPAYIAKVHTDVGPWTELHAAQKRGSSKNGEPSRQPSRPFTEGGQAFSETEEQRRWREGDAALAIVVNVAGEVLTVSRPEPPHEMAIPGGIVDPGEDALRAAVRELREETGVEPWAGYPTARGSWAHVCDLKSPTDGRKVSVFRFGGWQGDAQAREANTRIAWLRPSDLLAQATHYRATVQDLMNRGAFDVAAPFADLDPGAVHIGSGQARYRRGKPTEPKQMSVLTAKARKAIPRDYFALPKEKKYPINNAVHVHDAAARLEGENNKGAISAEKYREAKRNIAKRARQLGVESKYAPKKKGGPRVRIHGELGKGGSIHVSHLMSHQRPRAIGDVISLSKETIDAAKMSDDADRKVWIELGAPGRYLGHPAGDINLTPEVFAEIVRNFNADKAKNPNRNIPIDFNHASEQDPTSGSIPENGTPACGWIHALKCDDRGHLWGLVQWLPKARGYIQSGEYQGISPAIRFGSKDKQTGAPIGARLSSAGLTNQPFLDLAKLVASENQKGTTEDPVQLSLMSAAGYAHSADEYMPKIRKVFGLHPLATTADCSEALSNLRDKFAACGGNPQGVHQGTGLAEYCFGMRDLVGAAPGATWEDIFDTIEGLISDAVGDFNDMYSTAPPDGGVSTNDEGLEPDGEMTMADANLTALLSETNTKLGAAEAKLAEAASKITLSEQTLAAEKTARVEADKKVTTLTAQFSAMDAELTTLRTKLASQQVLLDERTAQDIERDVTDAIATYADTKGTKEEMRASLVEFRKSAAAAFSTMYPKVGPGQQHLQRTIVAGGGTREPTVARVGDPQKIVIDKAALAHAVARMGHAPSLADAQARVLCMSDAELAKAAKQYMGVDVTAA